MWNRKRSTGLVLVEILICFLVLCGILAAGIHLVYEWSKPLGFDFENVWSAEVSGMDWTARDEELAADRRTMADLLRAGRGVPGSGGSPLS